MKSLQVVAGLLGAFLIVGCAAQSGATRTSTVGSPVATAGSALGDVPSGTWTMTLTEEDLRAAGFTEPGALAENTGTFTLTMTPDGGWTMAQIAAQPVKWPVFRGTFAVTGEDTIAMRTTFPPDYAGDVISVKLTESPDGVGMKLLSPDDPLLRVQLESHVWAPSR